MLGLCAIVVKRSPNDESALARQMDAAIRSMIVMMMDANYVSEHLSRLKKEMSDISGTNARYWNKQGHTSLQKSASALRHDRLVEIKLELSDMMKRCA
jgi:hypothetical protein